MKLRPATHSDLGAIAGLVAANQSRPDRNIAYLGTEVDGIAAEIEDLGHDWTDHSQVIMAADGSVAGFLAGEIDQEMGRVWWLGPFAADDWASSSDALYGAARRSLPSAIVEEELAGDDRHRHLADFAQRHGFRPQEASALLNLTEQLDHEPAATVVPLQEHHHAAIGALHDRVFPRTHLPFSQLVIVGDRKIRLVAEVEGKAAGYVAAERQADQSGYIDFLAVDPAHRRRGLGADLVAAAVEAVSAIGALNTHLSVRETNNAARRLYTSLGFTEERLARPYRLGFHLD